MTEIKQKLTINFQTIYKYILFILLLVYLGLNIASGYQYDRANMLISIIAAIVLIYKSKKEIGSTIVFIFLLLSLVQISPQFFFGVKTTAYNFYYTTESYSITIASLMLYVTTLAIFYKKRTTSNISKGLDGNNSKIFSVLYFICLLIIIFGMNRGPVTEYSVRITPIYEYFTLVFCLTYYYSKKNTTCTILLLLIAAIYVLQDFYYGGRISSVQLIILLAILYFHKIKFKYIVISVIPAYIGLKFIEAYRVVRSVADLRWSHIIGSLALSSDSTYKWNTFSEVLYSAAGLTYVKENVFTLQERLTSLFDFFKNIFVGGENLFGDVVSYISQNISPVGGGGLLPSYFYFWLGWVGVLIIAGITIKLMNMESKDKSKDFHKLAYILLLALFPRWFFYTPLILFRYVILNFIILYVFLKIIDTMIKEKSMQSGKKENILDE